MSQFYIMEGNKVKQVDDYHTWALWMGKNDRSIKRTELFPDIGKIKDWKSFGASMKEASNKACCVSTVFLGLDHNHYGGRPILFESMVFGGKHDLNQYRYHTIEEAIEGHEQMCMFAQESMNEEMSESIGIS